MRGARKRQCQHELEAPVVDLAPHARHDLRREQEHGTDPQQGRNHRSLQQAALRDGELREEGAQGNAGEERERREPHQAAAARLDEHEAPEN